MPDHLKLTPDAEAAWDAYVQKCPSFRHTRTQFLAGFAAALAQSWRVNPDGSVSPPGHTDETARVWCESREEGNDGEHYEHWCWEIGDRQRGGWSDRMTEAARALLEALEESDGKEAQALP